MKRYVARTMIGCIVARSKCQKPISYDQLHSGWVDPGDRFRFTAIDLFCSGWTCKTSEVDIRIEVLNLAVNGLLEWFVQQGHPKSNRIQFRLFRLTGIGLDII